MYLSEPFLQVRHSSIICFNQPVTTFNRSTIFRSKPTYSHKVTDHVQKRIRRAIDVMLQTSPTKKIFNPVIDKFVKHKLSFITLTISANEKHIDSATGYKLLLKPFLQKMVRKHNLKTYIWKAEYQKNGQLHYHLLTPSWIHYENIRNDWNNTLEQHGFLSSWRKNYGNRTPNSTDIHAIYKIKNIAAYLEKYLSKKEKDVKSSSTQSEFYIDENGSFQAPEPDRKGKVWDCSMNLKKAKFFTVQLPNCLEYFYDLPERISCDQCIILKTEFPLNVLPPGLVLKYKKWLAAFISR